MGRERSRGRLALLALFALLLPAAASAQQALPRPPRLTDLLPHSTFSIAAEYGRPDGLSGLAFPIALDYRLARDVVFTAEFPFGYVNPPGEISTPVVGNVGVGARLVRSTRLGYDHDLYYGAHLSGRAPTAPGIDPDGTGAVGSVLRLVTPYDGERWTPGSAAVRLDLAAAFDAGPFTLEGEIGGTGILPIDSRPATAALHYGLVAGFRAFRGAWLVVEIAGAELAPGMPDAPRGHVLTVAPALRLDLGGVAPAVWVSLPVLGSAADRTPLALGLELAAF